MKGDNPTLGVAGTGIPKAPSTPKAKVGWGWGVGGWGHRGSQVSCYPPRVT